MSVASVAAQGRCSSKNMHMISKITAVLAVACVVAEAPSAIAAPRQHRHSSHHALARTHAIRMFEPRFNPYAYGLQPDSSAEERWFDRAKGNIW
jgi:hypothetical protein